MIFERIFPEILILEDNTTEVINTKNFIWFSDTIVETGTCNGAGIDRFLKAGFLDVRSVEMEEKWYNYTAGRFTNIPNVKLWLGNSSEKLEEMLPEKPAVVILDAHPAGPGTAGHEEIIKLEAEGKASLSDFYGDNILKKELGIIKKSRYKHLIIIDDQHSVNPLWIEMFPDYDYEHVNSKYLVLIPR